MIHSLVASTRIPYGIFRKCTELHGQALLQWHKFWLLHTGDIQNLGIILYSEDHSDSINVPGAFMASREYVTPHDLAEELLPSLLRYPEYYGRTTVIYTNRTENENIEYIKALKEANDLGTVIIMCSED